MFNLFYGDLQYLSNPEVLLTDTDSLLLKVDSLYLKEQLESIEGIMDYSNYDRSHPKFTDKHKNRVGFLKDEVKGKTIDEFAGLRSKSYSMTVKGSTIPNSKCKGVPAKAIARDIPHSKFKKAVKTIFKATAEYKNLRYVNIAAAELFIINLI